MINKTTTAFAVSLSLALFSGTSAGMANEMSQSSPFSDRPFAEIIKRYAQANGIPLELAHAVITIESNYDPSSTGAAGEVGLMQIKPATARDMGFDGSVKALYNPETNIKYGMLYLAGAQERGGGTTCGTILKYNAGHYAESMNPVSRNYCEKVKVELAKL